MIGFLIIGGVFIMAFVSKDHNVSEAQQNMIEENVKQFFQAFHLDAEKVAIEKIGDPVTLPSGEKQFFVYVKYVGNPNFNIALDVDAETNNIKTKKEELVAEIFNVLYLEERYEDFKPAIDFLSSLNVKDLIRESDSKIKFFYTSLGINKELNRKIVQAFEECDFRLAEFKEYIRKNMDSFKKLNSLIDIRGELKGLTFEEVNKIRTHLSNILPKGEYNVSIGISNWETGAHDGLFETIKIE